MKIVLFDREGADDSLSGFRLIADSAITPPGRPVFMPDFASACRGEVYLAVKVSRLGKNIAAKFAGRYFESFALAFRLIPLTDVAGAEMMIDNALTFSEWISVGDFPDSVSLEVFGHPIRINDLSDILSQAVVDVSRYSTLKTGDILLPFRIGAPIPIEIGTSITVSIAGRSLLNLKIK